MAIIIGRLVGTVLGRILCYMRGFTPSKHNRYYSYVFSGSSVVHVLLGWVTTTSQTSPPSDQPNAPLSPNTKVNLLWHGIHIHQICSLSQYSLFWLVCSICAFCCSEVLWPTFKYIGFSLSIFCIENKCCSAFSQGKESRSSHVNFSCVSRVTQKKLTSYGITER